MLAVLLAAQAPAQRPTPETPPIIGEPKSPFIAPATIDNNLEVTGDTLKAKSIDTRMAVDVSINGGGPYRFMVDSGADRSVIGRALADRLALEPAEQLLLHGTAGSLVVDTVHLNGLKVGSSLIDHIQAPALPEQYMGAQGMIGIDALSGQRLRFDFDTNQIVVQDARIPETHDNNGQEIVVTARRQHGQLIIAEARAGAQKVFAVIDSGADVTIANSALREKIFAKRRVPPTQKITLIGVTGQEIPADLIILPQLQIGGIFIQDVPVAFADAPPFALFGLAEQPALLLGTDLLRSFRRVSLDFRNRRVRFTLRRDTSTVPVIANGASVQ